MSIRKKEFYIFVGAEVTGLSETPLEIFGLALPRTKYAVITLKGKDMFNGGDIIWGQWLPSSAYQESHPFLIQAYDETRFHGLHDEASKLDWMVPIRKKG
jgi:AraC family transcriptional regulator